MKNSRKRNYRFYIPVMFSIFLAAMIAGGCDNTTSPNQELRDRGLNTGVSGILQNVQDEPVYMAEGFTFLPPMVKNEETIGKFDPGLSPVVEICETTDCSEILASYNMDEQGSERVRVDEEDEHYIVNWHVRQSGAVAGQTYRVRVLVNDLVLGHADVHVVSNGREANQYHSAGEIAAVANKALPVKFRIEENVADAGITIDVTPEAAEVVLGVDAIQLQAIVRDESGSEIENAQVTWSTEQTDIIFLVTEPIVDFDVEPGFVFGIAPGSALVTATFAGISASSFITVLPAPCEARVSEAVRFGNLSPGYPVVDVAVDGVPLGLELEFGDVSDYMEISGCAFTFVEADTPEVVVSPSQNIFPPVGTANSMLLVGTPDVNPSDQIYKIEEYEGLGFWEDGIDVDLSLTYVEPYHAAVSVGFLATRVMPGLSDSPFYSHEYLDWQSSFLHSYDADLDGNRFEVDFTADDMADFIFPLPELSPGRVNHAIFVTDAIGNFLLTILPPNKPMILISPDVP